VVRAVTYAFCSLPTFFVALLLLYFLSVQLHLLPVRSTPDLAGIVMPTLSLALPLSAWYVRQVRTVALEQLDAPYVDGLRSRGVSEKSILFKHVLRNSLVPVLALVGISVGSLLGGSAIVESIFNWPGVGNLSVAAIGARDYAVVQGYALLMAIVYLVVNWAVGLLQRLIDPRIGKGAL
jgi:peptide/nickel transport system permease protein